MRIEFPNSAREDFHWAQVQLRVGSAPDNDLVVAAQPAASHHLRIQQDRRGWVLRVMPAAGRVYVNARPVRERALLRPGDILSIGDCRMLLCADEDPAMRAPFVLADKGGRTVALRAVAGPWSGRVLSVKDRLEFGAQGVQALDLPQGEQARFAVFWCDGQLWLEAVSQSSRYPLYVNGTVVRRVALRPGDQLGIAMHRFVLDAPCMVATPAYAVAEMGAEHLPEEAAGPRGEVWWLIATASVLALGIALMLLIRF